MDLSKLQYTPRKLMLNQCKAGDVVTAELWNSVLGFFVQNTNSIQDMLSAHGEAFATMYNTFTVVLDDVREMQYKTEQAKASLENGTLWIFDGGNAEGAIDLDGDNTPETNVADVKIVIDNEMSDNSSNMVKNKAIKKYVDTAVSTGVQNLETNFNTKIDTTKKETQDYIDNQVKEVSENVAAFKGSVADYIIEQGMIDGWTYRKWNSGMAEMWLYAGSNETVAGDPSVIICNRALPFNLKVTEKQLPIINVSGYHYQHAECYITLAVVAQYDDDVTGGSTATVMMKCVKPDNITGYAWFNIYVMGMWK